MTATGHERDEHDARDVELLRAARQGDSEALGEILRRLEPLATALAERLSGAQLRRFESREDLCQEVLASMPKAFTHLREGADMEDARALLVQHARWVLSRHGQRAQRFQGESVVADADSTRYAQPSSTGEVTAADQQVWLQGLIEDLEPRLRTVVELRMQGLTFAAIGAALEAKEDTVRWRFLKAAERLRSRAGAGHPPAQGAD